MSKFYIYLHVGIYCVLWFRPMIGPDILLFPWLSESLFFVFFYLIADKINIDTQALIEHAICKVTSNQHHQINEVE